MNPVLAVFVLSAATLTVYVAPLVTLATDFFSAQKAPAWWKAGTHIVLGVISATVTKAVAEGNGLSFDNALLSSVIMTFVISGMTYLFVTRVPLSSGVSISTKIQSSKLTPNLAPPTTLVAAVNNHKAA